MRCFVALVLWASPGVLWAQATSDSQAVTSGDTSTSDPEGDAHRLIEHLTTENQQWSELRKSADGPAAEAEEARQEAQRLDAERKRQQERFQHVRDVGDLTDSIGQILQRYIEELPDVDYHRNRIRQRRIRVAEVRGELLELQGKASDLHDLGREVSKQLTRHAPMLDEEQRALFAAQVEQLLKQRGELLTPLIRDYQDLLDALTLQLGRTEDELIKQTIEFREYINERILWIPSMSVVGPADGPAALSTLKVLLTPQTWWHVGEILITDMRHQPMQYVTLFAVIVLVAATRRRMRRRVQRMGQALVDGAEPTILPMLESVAATIALAVPWSIMFWILGSRCRHALDASTLTQAIGIGLQAGAAALLNVELFRQISRKRGLAEAHFGMDPNKTRVWRRDLWVLLLVSFLTVSIVVTVRQFEANTPRPALSRLLFMAAMILLAVVANRILRPSYGVIEPPSPGEPNTWMSAWRRSARTIGVAVPLILAGVAALGYIYAAEELFVRLQMTLWLIQGLLLIGVMSNHWIELAQRRHPRADNDTDSQSRALFASLGALSLAVGCYWIWRDVMPALRILDQWELWSFATSTASTAAPAATGGAATPVPPIPAVTVGDLVLAGIVFLMTSVAARNLPGLLELVWFQRLPLDAGARYALTNISRYLIVLIGGVWMFQVLGVSWSNVQWLIAAISVGLGFGLQEIFANFVAGLIVLFERPIRIGDVVTIGGVSGTVTRIHARATVIRDGDRKELIVPNKQIITGNLINWTLTDTVQRVVVKVGISYESDADEAARVLLRVAAENSHLLRYPPPQAIVTNFASDAMEIELRAFVSSPDRIAPATHTLHVQIAKALREANMPIQFPAANASSRAVAISIHPSDPSPKGSDDNASSSAESSS